uniref:Ig-like domain-containing protein n=1 Tax=Paramormyrops kingsleyae TaxID=1676925 RepID=A0A3B3R0Z2_9TELE
FLTLYILTLVCTKRPHICNTKPLVEAGEDVTLECSFPKESAYSVFWFKLNFGQRPFLIAASHTSRSQETFNSNSTHYEVKQDGETNQLIILKTEPADSGMYYCGTRKIVTIFFGAGTFLRIRVEQHPVSDTVQPGDSVTLQCTIETGSCAGEHSVYWFRHGSGESLPGVIYSHGNRSDECEKSPEAGSPTRSCVYSLPKRNLSLSDAGTYYCAVAMCGEMLFGNGTKVDVEVSIVTLFKIHIMLLGLLYAFIRIMMEMFNIIYVTIRSVRSRCVPRPPHYLM